MNNKNIKKCLKSRINYFYFQLSLKIPHHLFGTASAIKDQSVKDSTLSAWDNTKDTPSSVWDSNKNQSV